MVGKLIGGWQWNGIFNAQGGFPISPLIGSNRSGNGDTRNPDRPNRNPDFQGKVIRGSDGFKKQTTRSRRPPLPGVSPIRPWQSNEREVPWPRISAAI